MGRSRSRGRPRKRRLRSRGDDDDAAAAWEEVEEEAGDDDPDPDPDPDQDPPSLPVGAQVEVRSDDPGFFGSYYEATVAGHRYQHSGLVYVVAYSTLTHGDHGGELRELAVAANVRPRPPQAPPREFAVHDMVDAFHNVGWWSGVVVSSATATAVPVPVPVPPPEPEAADTDPAQRRRLYSYKVCFPTSRELLDFEETALRPSRVFLHDRWVPAAEETAGTPLFREGSQVEVSRSKKTFGKYWSPATILKVIGASSFLVEYRDSREDGEPLTEILDSQYIRPARGILRMDSKYRFPPSSHAEVFHEGSWWPSVILEVLDIESTKKYVVKINSHEEDDDDVQCVDFLTVDHTQLRPRYDWYCGKWVRCLTEKSVNKGPQSKSRKRPASAVLALCNDSVDSAGSASCLDNDSISCEPDSYLMEKVNKDAVLEPVCPELVSNENFPTKHKTSTYPEKVVKQPGTVLSFESHLPTKHKTITYPEKAVKQQGTMLSFDSHLTLRSQSSAAGFGNSKCDDPKLHLSEQLERSSSPMMAKPSEPQAGQSQASLFGAFGTLRPLALPQTPTFRIPSHNIDFGSIVGSNKALTYQEKQSTDGCCDGMAGNKQNTTFGSFSAFKNLAAHEEHGVSKQDRPSAMVRYAAEVSQSVENSEITQLSSISKSNSNEAQPGNSLIIAPKGSEGTPTSKFVASRTLGSSLLQRSRNVHESIVAERRSESPDIPFVKTSPMWAQIEAMEVFRKVPQRPNFDKCQQHVPELREGMALGLMLSFANLAESVKRLCIEDEDAVFEEKMKGVSLLEADGFDVKHLRSRVETLRCIKNGRGKLQGAIRDLEKKICDEETQSQRHAQIGVLSMTVRQLELEAYLLRRVMWSAVSQKINDASEMLRLKIEVSELEQRFSRASMSPW